MKLIILSFMLINFINSFPIEESPESVVTPEFLEKQKERLQHEHDELVEILNNTYDYKEKAKITKKIEDNQIMQYIVLDLLDDGGDYEDTRRKRDISSQKEGMKQYIKAQVMTNLGKNITKLSSTHYPQFNVTLPITQTESKSVEEEQIIERIRSFYPSCDKPKNQNKDFWNKKDVMNLYFEYDYSADFQKDLTSNIATSTLRLYRLPQNDTTNHKSFAHSRKDDCDDEEEKLLRVSVYWYTTNRDGIELRRRLSDTKVISENAKWVELNVKPATKIWAQNTNENMGLVVIVEDQDDKKLRADKYFQGITCTVGGSTPKPIPAFLYDWESAQSSRFSATNSTSTIHSHVRMFPTLDICYIQYPNTINISKISPGRINACNIRRMYEESLRLVEKEKMERRVLQIPNTRHIRHQQHQLQQNHGMMSLKDFQKDFKSRAINTTVIFTKEELDQMENARRTNR